MKKYIVTEKLLDLAKKFINENPHQPDCALSNFWSDIDVCTCKNDFIRKEYIKECKDIIEIADKQF